MSWQKNECFLFKNTRVFIFFFQFSLKSFDVKCSMSGTFWEWIQLTLSVSEAMHLLELFGVWGLTLECSRFCVREVWTDSRRNSHTQAVILCTKALLFKSTMPGPTYKEAPGLCTDGFSLGSETAPFTPSIWQSKEGKAALNFPSCGFTFICKDKISFFSS